MRIILVLLLRLSLSYCDKLDRTYLPPPGSTYSGGRTDDLQPPFVINKTPGFPQQKYGSDIKKGDDYGRLITKPPNERNFFDGPRDQYDVTYEERNLSRPSQSNQNQQGQNKGPFAATVSPSVTTSTKSTDEPSYSQFGPDSFANPAFRPGSYNPETAQPGHITSVQATVTNDGRYNPLTEQKYSKNPQPDRFSNIQNRPDDNRPYNPLTDGPESPKTDSFPGAPSEINNSRQYGLQTGDLNDFQKNNRQPSQKTNFPELSESPNVNNQYNNNQKDQYSSINEYSPQLNAPGQINYDETSQPQDNLNRPQQKGQFNSGNISPYQLNLNSPINRPSYASETSTSPSFTINNDSPKPTTIFPGTYQLNHQNNTGKYYPETSTPAGSIFSYPESDNARLPVVYKRPERPQAALERNAIILDYKNILTPEYFEYSFDTSNGIHADEKGTALDGVKAEGSFSYTGDDGKFYEVVYSADENGFRPSGDHLPTPPPIPEAIQRVIEEAERNREAGVVHDGFYDDKKYGHKKYDKTLNRNKSKKARPESDVYNISDNDDDQEDFSNTKQKLQEEYYQDSNTEENLPKGRYQTDRQSEKPGANYDDGSDDERIINRRPINQVTGPRGQSNDRKPQYNQRGQQRKPYGLNATGSAKNSNDNQYSQKQPGKIIIQKFVEVEPESRKKIIDNDSYNRNDDQDDTSYPEQDDISIYDARDEKVKEKSNKRLELKDKPSQKSKDTRLRAEIREQTGILSKKPQKYNNNNIPKDNQYQALEPEYDSRFKYRQENINNYDDNSSEKAKYGNSEVFAIQPSIDGKYFRNKSDEQDYDFIEPDRITNENYENINGNFSTIDGFSKAPSSQRNKTKQGGYAYLPPTKQFYYEKTTTLTTKPVYADIETTQKGVNLNLEAPYTTQRPYTRYSTYRPSQNRPVETTDHPSTQQPSFETINDKAPYVQENNKRIPGKFVTIKPADTFVETSTKPYNEQTRPSPNDQNYPYYKETYQGTTPKQGPFRQKTTRLTYGTTAPSPALFEQTEIDQNYPSRSQNIGNDYTSQQQVYTTKIPKRTYETGYTSTTFRPKVRPGLTYEGKRPDIRPLIPETNQRPSYFKTPNKYSEPERYPTKEIPESNQYETPAEYQQTTASNYKRPTYTSDRQDYIPEVTRIPSKAPGFVPKQSERPNKTKTTTSNPRYQTTQRLNIPVEATEDTSDGYQKYEPSPNHPGKVLSNEREDSQQDSVRRPAFRPTAGYPSTLRPQENKPSVIQGTQTTRIYPDSQNTFPDNGKDTKKPYYQRTNVYSPDEKPKQPSDLTQGVPSTSTYPESQNVNYLNKGNEFYPNQSLRRPSNTYSGFKPTQPEVIQDTPRNLTQVISIDKTRPTFVDDKYPNERQDFKLSDMNQLQNIPREYYSQVKPKNNGFDEPKNPSPGTFSSQNRSRVPSFPEKKLHDLPGKLPENRPSIGNNVYPPNFNQGDFKGQNRDINGSYPSPAPEIIGEDFRGPKQTPKFDPKTGYHY